MKLQEGTLIVSKSVTVHTESGVGLTMKLKKGVAAVSVLLGFSSDKEPFTTEAESQAFCKLGFIGFTDLVKYIPREKAIEIERAEKKRLGL